MTVGALVEVAPAVVAGPAPSPLRLLGELVRQVVALLGQPPQLGDDLVEEVVDLLLVVATPELGRREVLVEDILGRERHVVTSVGRSETGPP